MRSTAVTIGKLRDGLSAHVRRVRRGESIVVLDRDRPVARLVPFEPDPGGDAELHELIDRGVIRPPRLTADWRAIDRMPSPRLRGDTALEALLDARDEA